MRQTTSILFFARKTTKLKNGKSPIFVRITIDGQRLDISLKRSIDSNKRKWKGNSLMTKENNQMNTYLKEIADLCDINKNLSTHSA
ncbi:Arm DNA-binding domain-containing protein [Labilibaculum euxinus]